MSHVGRPGVEGGQGRAHCGAASARALTRCAQQRGAGGTCARGGGQRLLPAASSQRLRLRRGGGPGAGRGAPGGRGGPERRWAGRAGAAVGGRPWGARAGGRGGPERRGGRGGAAERGAPGGRGRRCRGGAAVGGARRPWRARAALQGRAGAGRPWRARATLQGRSGGAGRSGAAERGAPGGRGRRCRGGAAGGRARCGRPGSERRPRAWPRPRAVPVAGPGPGRAGRCRDAAVAGGLAPVPRHVRAELARHRRALGHLHHLLRHHRRGGLHPALLGGRQREHAAARPLRPLPPVRGRGAGRGARGRGAGRARALLPRLLRRLRLHPVGRLPGRRLLRAALHGADAGLHRLLRALLLLQHGHGLQDLRLDAAAGSPLPGAGLHDLPGRLGRGDHPGHVRGEDREVRAGRLLRALGLHPGHHRHPQRPHTLLPGLRPRQPAERPAARRAQDREQRFCWHCEDIM